MNTILWLGLGILIGGIIIYFVLRPNLKLTQQLNQDIKNQNANLEATNNTLRDDGMKLSGEVSKLQGQKNEITKSIDELREQARQAGEEFYKTHLELAQEKLDTAIENVAEDYQEREQSYKDDFISMQTEMVSGFEKELTSKLKELSSIQQKLNELRSAVEASVEARKRAEEMETQQDFYRLTLSEEDINEIKKLREVIPYLRDKEPLNKVIYKVYYEKPYTDLIGRVVGSIPKTGIYKITNIDNGMCYVGQAANIAERWRQHIKRGTGAEAPTRNKLYPVMYKIGPEHFTFEIIEECDRGLLDAREDYWQDYFKAKEYGYSIK